MQNDPGGTIGGPVTIPHLYNGKDKTFFFVDFNVMLASQGNVYSTLVPTDLQKSGDFSQTFAGGQLVTICDPSTEHTASDGKTIVRNPFPGNVIPANRIDPVAAQIVKFYPEPNWTNGPNKLRDYAGQCPDYRRHESGSLGDGRSAQIPPRSVLSIERISHYGPSSPRTRRRYSAARDSLPPNLRAPAG